MKPQLIPVLTLLALCGNASATITFVPIDITVGTGSTATQSTPTSGTPPGSGFATNALNGNLGDFTHTSSLDPNPTWMGNLNRNETFNTILVYNRGGGCCPERLSDITVSVLNNANVSQYNSGVLNPGNVLGGPSVLNLNLGSSVTGSQIVVARDGLSTIGAQGVLSIGEVRIGNVANVILPLGTNLSHTGIIGASVSQSSTLSVYGAGSAVNGATNDFTHTSGGDTNPSWTMDFGEMMNLESFDIGNRGDGCCQYRLRDISVTVRDSFNVVVFDSGLLNPENALGSPLNLTGTFSGGLQGRYVTISRTPDPDGSGNGGIAGSADDQNVLSMSEVNIYGSSIPEPSAMLLLPLALAGVMRRRR